MALVTFLAHGQGDAKKAADYLVGDIDHTGEVRAEVRVLRGDPFAVAIAANSLSFKNKYRSGVFSWAKEDDPTDQETEETVRQIEILMTAGFENGADRIPYSVILHVGQDGSKHLHILAANVDLQTGKHYNIAPVGWEKAWGAMKDYLNKRFNWADPSDPARARTLSPGIGAKIVAAAKREVEAHAAEVAVAAGDGSPEPKPPKIGKGKAHVLDKHALHEYIESKISDGTITDRKTMVQNVADTLGFSVNRSGTVKKTGLPFLTFKDPETGEKYRMEGTIYDESFKFTAEDRGGDPENRAANSRRDPVADPADVEQAKRNFERYLIKHAEYNVKRYAKSGRTKKQLGARAGLDPEVVQDVQGKPEQATDRSNQQARDRLNGESAELGQEVIFDDGSLFNDLARNFQLDDLVNASSTTAASGDGLDHRENGDQWEADASDQRSELDSLSNFDSEPAEPAADNTNLETLPQRMNAEREIFRPENDFEQLNNEVMYEEQQDRNRNTAAELVEQIEQRISAARAAIDRLVSDAIAASVEQVRSTVHSTSAAVERFVQQIRSTDNRVRKASSDIEGLAKSQQPTAKPAAAPAPVMANDQQELGRFKSEINLTEFLMSDGFQMDKKESSKSSHVMRRGAEKIIVSRQQDGHFVYFNVHDDHDHGTIIDYLKNQKNQNLGQTRKELRPWVGLSGEPSPSFLRRSKAVEKPAAPDRTTVDQQKFNEQFFKMDNYKIDPDGGDYLQEKRGLDPETIKRFQHVIGIDAEKAVTFLHTNSDNEMTGWERKNLPDGRSGFAAGGKKSLFDAMAEHDTEEEKRLVIVESAIDALSFNELYGRDGDRYVSFGGSMSEAQKAQLKALVEASPSVLIAVDNDTAGHAFTDVIQGWRDDCSAIKPPDGFKDWNDYLQAIKSGDAELNPDLVTPSISSRTKIDF